MQPWWRYKKFCVVESCRIFWQDIFISASCVAASDLILLSVQTWLFSLHVIWDTYYKGYSRSPVFMWSVCVYIRHISSFPNLTVADWAGLSYWCWREQNDYLVSKPQGLYKERIQPLLTTLLVSQTFLLPNVFFCVVIYTSCGALVACFCISWTLEESAS